MQTTMNPSPKISMAELRHLRTEMLEQFESFEGSFRKNSPLLWWGTLVGPFVVTGLLLLLFSVIYGWEWVGKLAGAATIAFFFFGRFIILGGKDHGADQVTAFLSPEALFGLMTYLDLLVAVVLSFHIGFMFKIPLLGPKVSELVVDGRVILAMHPWIRRMTFAGLIAFVVFPLAATGSIGGSIFGRLLGMDRLQTLVGIATGSLIGNGIMYVFADAINRYLDRDNPLLFWGGVAVIAVIIFLLERRFRRFRKEMVDTGD